MNPWSLNFHKRFDHSRYNEITVEVALGTGCSLAAVDAKLDAKLDTGSNSCIYQPCYACLLRLDLDQGIPERIHTAANGLRAYGQQIGIQVRDLQYEQLLYLNPYESP